MVLRNVTAIAENEKGNAIHAARAVRRRAHGRRRKRDRPLRQRHRRRRRDRGRRLPQGASEHHQLELRRVQPTTPPDAAVDAARHRAATSAAAPAFLDAAGGDFHVDGELADARRRDRRPRRSAASTWTATTAPRPGASAPTPVPDMGAYERTPTAGLPAAAARRRPAVRTAQARLPRSSTSSSTRRPATGRLLVEVPERRAPLSLTGSGVKLVRRTAARRRRRDLAADPDLGDNQGAAGETRQGQGAAEGRSSKRRAAASRNGRRACSSARRST